MEGIYIITRLHIAIVGEVRAIRPVRLSPLLRGSLVCLFVCLDVCLSFTFLGLSTLYSDHVIHICQV